MEPWYKVVTARKEVREGRSFNPDEFAIDLDQVVQGTAPLDYRDPEQFFRRTVFTRSLKDHAGQVLRRLAGETENTAPVMTLVTQFGGGKTHTLAALYHLASGGGNVRLWEGVNDLLFDQGIREFPQCQRAVFVGNAWDPQPGRETPWIDIARQIAGDRGVAELGEKALRTPPGTSALQRVFAAAEKPVLLLFDEVLNYINRHRDGADSFHAFIQNLTVACTGVTGVAAVISLPRSQVEMTDYDYEWQEKIKKVVRRVAEELISNDESEISEVIRRRLFENLGDPRKIELVCQGYADWCYQNRGQLPTEWVTVGTATKESHVREVLKARFLACYPFHPATLTVFQRKWQSLAQFQRTRGTLAMLAQWVSIAQRQGYTRNLQEGLISLGAAPLDDPKFQAAVLGQIGEERLMAAISADIATPTSHAHALDIDAAGALRDIHRRVATSIFFESSGGMVEKSAHLPELRFAVGGPNIDVATIDNAAHTLENRCFFLRKVGTDGYRIGYKPTLKKVVNDRRASLDREGEIEPAVRELIRNEFEKDKRVPLLFYPKESGDVGTTTRLTIVVLDPSKGCDSSDGARQAVNGWARAQGKSPRLYPGALLWHIPRAGNQLLQQVEEWRAWLRVQRELQEGLLGTEFDEKERHEVIQRVVTEEREARQEIWSCYRYVVLTDHTDPDGLKVIDLGAGHSSASETLSGRILAALKMHSLLNEGIGPGYLLRRWPEAFKLTGLWPLDSLRSAFLNGGLERLIDPDRTLRDKLPEFVAAGEFGLAEVEASSYQIQRLWFRDLLAPDEIEFASSLCLVRPEVAEAFLAPKPDPAKTSVTVAPAPTPVDGNTVPPVAGVSDDTAPRAVVTLQGTLPTELWNVVGTRLISKLRQAEGAQARVEVTATAGGAKAQALLADIKTVLQELGSEHGLTVSLHELGEPQ